MTDFDFLATAPAFEPFAGGAEHIHAIDPSACALNCRRALGIARLVAFW